MPYVVNALEDAAITQIFLDLPKGTDNVSHKIFHKPQIPGLCGFIIARPIGRRPTTLPHAVYSKVTQGFADTENGIAPTAPHALSCDDR
jgi:hypothetical protein